MIPAPLFPDLPAKPAGGRQDGIARFGTGTLVLPWLGVLACRNECLRSALCNRFVAAFRVVGAVATDARDNLLGGYLVEQARQHWGIAGGIVGHLDRPDFQRGRVNAKVDLAPLATVVGTMLLRLPLAFAQHLDACTVDQQVQSRRRRLRSDRHRKTLLAPADRAEVGHLPVQSGQPEQTLRHTHGLAQGQIEQALNGQAELDRRLAVLRTAAPLAARTAVPAHVLVQPDQQRAAGFQCRVVVFPVGRSVLQLYGSNHAVSLPVLRLGR